MALIPFRRPRHLSKKGAAFIGAFEGFRGAPYNDPVGHATIGFGHLLHLGNVTAADRRQWGTLTRAEALKLLQKDAERFAKEIHRLVKPKLNQAQFDALVSFAFNVGTGAFEDSTLLKVLNSMTGTRKGVVSPKNHARVREQLLRWSKAGGQTLPGLLRRRKAEARLFATGKYDTR